jgi:ankyrin repeat protein
LDRKNNNGVSALMETAKSEHSAVLNLLITKGADVNAKGIQGHTALIFASYNRRLENVKLLLEAGADPDATAADDDDPNAKRYDASKFATPEIYDLIQDAKNRAKQRKLNP